MALVYWTKGATAQGSTEFSVSLWTTMVRRSRTTVGSLRF